LLLSGYKRRVYGTWMADGRRQGGRPHGVCDRCGDVIGVYEPVWIEHDDGRITEGSLLGLDSDSRRKVRRTFHRDCVVPDQLR